MDEFNKLFNEYMEEVKKLPINQKRTQLYNSLMELGNGIIDIANAEGITLHFLQNKEIFDLNKDNLSEDDYLEAMLVYSEMIKEIIGEYFLNKQSET